MQFPLVNDAVEARFGGAVGAHEAGMRKAVRLRVGEMVPKDRQDRRLGEQKRQILTPALFAQQIQGFARRGDMAVDVGRCGGSGMPVSGTETAGAGNDASRITGGAAATSCST